MGVIVAEHDDGKEEAEGSVQTEVVDSPLERLDFQVAADAAFLCWVQHRTGDLKVDVDARVRNTTVDASKEPTLDSGSESSILALALAFSPTHHSLQY